VRALPVDRAIALHGVVPGALAGRKMGVDGARVLVLKLGRLGLVTSSVDPGEFSAGAIERADDKWLRGQARHQERVLERLHAEGTVWPAPFLTSFEDLEALDGAARANYIRWNRALTRVSGKVEYTVHAFVGPHALPALEPYVLRVARRTSRSAPRLRQPVSPLDAHARALYEGLRASAAGARRFSAPGLRGFVMGVALLIDEGAADAVQGVLATFAPEGHALGLSVYVEGPRPPFSFS
jgi:gas vesicle protein GvpL/GvpF